MDDPSKYFGTTAVFSPGEYNWPIYCGSGYEWSDRTNTWKYLKCVPDKNGTRVFYYDLNNQIEVSCVGIDLTNLFK